VSIARLGEAIENPSVTQIMAAYPDKEAFDLAVQQGKIKPTTEAGVVANIYNRIVNAALARKAQSELTVFQENTGAVPQPQMGLAAAQQMQGQPQPQGQGLAQIPVPEQMFEPQGMAGGGIVAFQGAGFVSDRRLLAMMNGQERAEYQRTGKIPERLQQIVQPISSEPYAGADATFTKPAASMPIDMSFNNAAFAPEAPRGRSNLPSTAQTAAQQATVQQAGAQPAAVAQPETDEQRFLKNWEMQQRILGQDPTRERLKALFEKQEREAEEGSRKDQAMRLIEAGLGIAGGTSPYFAANLAGATPALKGYGEDLRARRKEATERAKGMAELEGMTRKEKAEVLGRTMAESREEKKTKEERDFRERLVRLQESLKPEDYRNRILNILTDPRSTEAQKSAARAMLSTGTSGGRLTASQTANIRAKAINNAKDKLMMDPRYLKAKTPQDKEAVQKIIEREEFERLLPDQNEGDKDPLGLFG